MAGTNNLKMPKAPKLQPEVAPTHFGRVLKDLLADKDISAFSLHQESGIAHSVLSRLLTGQQPWISQPMLARIAQAISSDPKVQAKLIVAKLMDEMNVPELSEATKLIDIRIGGHAPTESGSLKHVPKQLEGPVKALVDRARKSNAFEAALINLAASLDK